LAVYLKNGSVAMRNGGGVKSSVTLFDTSFPATENPISEGGIWQNGGQGGSMPFGNVQTISGKAMAAAYVAAGEYTDASAIIDPSFRNYGPDQWAEVTVYRDVAYTNTAAHELIIALRGTVNVNGPNYYPHYHLLLTMGGGFQLFWLNGVYGDFTEITGITTSNGGISNLVTGDVLRGEIQGTAIRLYLNGTLRYNATDSNITTGQPGMMFFVREGAGQDYSKFCISRFRCGSL